MIRSPPVGARAFAVFGFEEQTDRMPAPYTSKDFAHHLDRARSVLKEAGLASDHEKPLLVAEAQAHATVAQTIAIWLQHSN